MPDEKTIQMMFVGDTMFNAEFLLPPHDNEEPDYYLSEFKDLFKEADVVCANLECTLFREGSPLWPNAGFQLYSPPDKMLPLLKYMNVSVLSMSNNHVYDYGIASLLKTKDLLGEHYIASFGGGKDELESRQPLLIEKKGLRLGFLGYSMHQTDRAPLLIFAGTRSQQTPKNAASSAVEIMTSDIQSLRSTANIVIVSLHWGYEYFKYPSPAQIELAHTLIDAGADIIVGHHPHCVQGIEKYKAGTIFYSLGNFFFCNHHRRREYPTYGNEYIVALVDYCEGCFNVEAIVGIMDFSNRMILNINDCRARKRLFELSLRLASDGYASFWNDYRRRTNRYLKHLKVINMLRFAISPAYYRSVYNKVRKRGIKYGMDRVHKKMRAISRALRSR